MVFKLGFMTFVYKFWKKLDSKVVLVLFFHWVKNDKLIRNGIYFVLSPAVRFWQQQLGYRRCLFNNHFDNNFTLVLKRVLICMAHVLWNECCLHASTLISCAILIQHDLESQLSSPRVLTHAFVKTDHVLKISWRCGWHSQRWVYFSLKMRLCWLAVYKC